jgi:hypothetical protein
VNGLLLKIFIYSLILFFHLSTIEYHECSYVTPTA